MAPRHPSAASTIARLLNGDPRRITLFIAGIASLGSALWWYSDALSRASELHEQRRLVYGGLAAIGIAALSVACVLWRIGRAAIAQRRFPPDGALAGVLMLPPGNALTDRAAVRRGRLLIGIACGLPVWVVAVFVLMRHIEQLARAQRLVH
jgi:hypothetical protein